MRLLSVLTIIVLSFTGLNAQVTLDYYLPSGTSYDSSIPTPKEILGTEVGEWHVRHDQLVQYVYAVAEASERVTITEHARSYEQRPLVHLTITSPQNHRNLEQIRQQHIQISDASTSGSLNTSEMPAVVQLGYSVHGNESSGSNASMVVLYHLAAAQGGDINDLLDNTVILLDPSFNPDGLSRFAQWANMHRGKTAVADPRHREHNEIFPSGRTNHYWFDLNRDWLLVQHPESQGRIQYFHKWLPNILTDHHEMGTNSTFFFQPGIPSRTHPLTPQKNQDLTGEIATYHAEAFNQEQELYYTKESFDDFYYGKGSTYPDINGSIGILFEQASSRGHAQESIHGVLRFPETIKNQITASFSTLEAARNMRTKLLNYQREFYQNAAEEARNDDTKAYVFGTEHDPARTAEMAKLLDHHGIQMFELKETINTGGEQFPAGETVIVPLDQKKYRLIKAIFEQRTSFQDSLFYDVSTFTIPHSFNMPFAELDKKTFRTNLQGPQLEDPLVPASAVFGGKSDYAYLFEWDSYYAPRALYRLQKIGVRTKVASKPFTTMTRQGTKQFDYGTIMVALGTQQVSDNEIHEVMNEIAANDGVDVYAVPTGYTPTGIDLGSRSFENLNKPNVAILIGDGVSSYEAGEAWHLLDQRYHMAPTLLEKDALSYADIQKYNVIVMVDGRYSDISERGVENLTRWTQSGGTIIAIKDAIRWAKTNNLADVTYLTESENGETEDGNNETRPYAKLSEDRGAQFIGGTIFENRLDLTHPLGYGFNRSEIPVFRNSTLFLQKGENPYSTPLSYTDSPLLSGYVSEENLNKLSGTAGIIVSSPGRGTSISMVDNPNFRAFWYGTNKLFANAIFFGQTISGASAN